MQSLMNYTGNCLSNAFKNKQYSIFSLAPEKLISSNYSNELSTSTHFMQSKLTEFIILVGESGICTNLLLSVYI